MLRRQQATAIVAARIKIVEGAVSMVEMALEQLSQKQIIELDEEQKATMVSNLMVVLCSDKDATPVLNNHLYYDSTLILLRLSKNGQPMISGAPTDSWSGLSRRH